MDEKIGCLRLPISTQECVRAVPLDNLRTAFGEARRANGHFEKLGLISQHAASTSRSLNHLVGA